MERYLTWVIRWRLAIIAVLLIVSAVLAVQIRHLRIIIDPETMFPQNHPYVVATKTVEKLFGSRRAVIIGITPKQGNAFQPDVLNKVQRITDALLNTPGVLPQNVLSLASPKVKSIIGTQEGMEVRRLMESVPTNPAEIAALRQAYRANPVYLNSLVSTDERTTAVLVDFDEGHGGFRGMLDTIRAIVDRERDATVDIALGGGPVFLAQIETYSQRMIFLFPLAVLIAGLIHYEAFRTAQGLILPLVTALLAVVWGLGIMSFAGVPMDVFNATTPILILAVAAGHAVQILKRYYEEYHRIQSTTALSPRDASRAAVVQALTKIGPVMLTAGGVATLGFLSLIVFKVSTIRTFGAFTALGIASAVLLELTFIPALRACLPPPGQRETEREQHQGFWDRITGGIGRWVTGPRRWPGYIAIGIVVAVCAAGTAWVVTDSSNRSFFFSSLTVRRDDATLNERLGGTNTLYLLIEGDHDDVIKEPRVLRAMEAAQQFLERQPHVGKTVSLADFVKRMNQAVHREDPAYNTIPESRDLISQYLLLYSMSGQPTDFDQYVDYGYRSANVWVFLKTDSTAYVEDLIAKLRTSLPVTFGEGVRISLGGSVARAAALNEVIVHGKIVNIAQIGGVIMVITAVVFRSIFAGLLVLVPLLLAVIANFGFMGLTGIPLNIGTSVISAMAVGIGADYAIYLIYRIREELAHADETTAFRTALTTAGKAILFVASAVAGGYGVLLLSYGFYIHVWFALLIAASMLVSSLAALTLVPGLLLTFRPRFVFRHAHNRLQPTPPVTAVVIAAVAFGLLAPAAAAQESAKDIMEKNSQSTKVLDSVSNATFTLINKDGQERVRKTVAMTKLQPNGRDNRRATWFLSPPDVKGTSTLLVERSDGDDDMWIYLPALKNVRRLTSANKKESFVGTDFSYGDVIGHKVEEWEHKILREETVDGQRCHVVESVARDDKVKASTGYSKRLSYIRADNYVMIKGEFWDAAGKPLKAFKASDVQNVDPARSRWQPMVREMANLQTGHRTVIRNENYKVNQQIKDEIFTTRNLEREP